jgi:hypothetical protein
MTGAQAHTIRDMVTPSRASPSVWAKPFRTGGKWKRRVSSNSLYNLQAIAGCSIRYKGKTMKRRIVIRNMVLSDSIKDRYFSTDGFKIGSPLVSLDKAKKFRTHMEAERFLADMRKAGYVNFRISWE